MASAQAVAPRTESKAGRLHYIDWFRGLAALIMLQGHSFHAFTRPDLRDQSGYVLSQFVGGLPPAVFLFLAGLTLALRLDGAEKKGLPPLARVVEGWKRSGYLFVLAFLFRFQMWVFGWPNSPWTDIFRVDILNAMGLGVAVMSLMGLLRTEDRMRLSFVLGSAIALASPIASAVDWPAIPVLKQYLAPDYNFFGFFPWAAFVAFGMSLGSIVRRVPDANSDRMMQWCAIAGGVLIFGGRYFAEIPYSLYPKSEFWLDSPTLIFIKLGILLWLLTFAFIWTRYAAPGGWSWVRQLGTTSLLVYWVHVELVYGRWLWMWKENLDLAQSAAMAVAVTVAMLLLSVAKTSNWSLRSVRLDWFPFSPSRGSRVSGD